MTGTATADEERSVHEAADAAATLREAFDDLERIERHIADLGLDRVETAADRYRRAHRVLKQYEEDAVGTGDFSSYVKFEAAFDAATDTESGELAASAFEAANDAVDKRRLSTSDFEAAREALEPAGDYIDLLERRDEAVDAYRAARRDAKEALAALEGHVEELEDLASLADVDLDAPVASLHDPIEAYNEAVREAFHSFKKSASARELFDLLDLTEQYPLVDVDQPPRDLAEYVTEYDAGEEPVTDLLEYADYSKSKLDHYVDDPGALRTAVAVHRTYLERIDGEPLTIEWPPKPAEELTFRIKELTPIVSRFADEDTVATLRAVRRLAKEDDYDTLRRAAEVRVERSDEELALLESGSVDDRLAEARDIRDLVAAILEETDR